jgi:hypothetical protein
MFYIDKRGCQEEVDDLKCPDTLDEMLLIVRQVRSALPVSRQAAAYPSSSNGRMASTRTDSADDHEDEGDTGSSRRQSSTCTDPVGDHFKAAVAYAAAHPHRRRPVMQASSSRSSAAEDSNEPLSLPDYSIM